MKKVILGLVSGVIIFGGGVTALGSYYSHRFLPGSSINGVDVSNLDFDVGKDKASKECGNAYSLKVKLRNGEEEIISGSDIDMGLNYDNSGIAEQGLLKYITNKAQLDFKGDYEYNKDKAIEYIKELKEFDTSTMEKPKDAYIGEFNGEEFELIPETDGNYINIDKASEKILEALDNEDKEVTLDSDCYIKAKVRKESLMRKHNELNKMVNSKITYTFDDGSTLVVNKSRISNWVDKDTLEVNEELVRKFLDTVRNDYDTAYKNINFTTTKGDLVKISGPYGYVLTKDDECAELIRNIKEGVTIRREPIWIRKGNDLKNKSYIEVSLSDQHVWMYVNGELVVETDCVTGTDSNKDRRTTPGVYPITYKQSPAVLKGPGYSSPVSYWMPFNGGQGLHDATWRSSFGGSIYKHSGSHGCVNLPLSKAKIIYEHAWKGMPVIVY